MDRFFDKKLFAPLLFILSFSLIYSVVLENIVWIDGKQSPGGIFVYPDRESLSWGNHNIVFLITVTIASFISSVITGALLKKPNSILSVICVVAVAIYLFAYEKDFLLAHTFTSIFSLITSAVVSFSGSNFGVQIEQGSSSEAENKLLGINTFHWIWILFPLSFAPMYLWGAFFVHTIFRFSSLWWTSEETAIRIASLICVVPIIAWILIPVSIYSILSGKVFSDKGSLVRSAIVISIVVLGSGAAMIIQVICYYIIEKFLL